MMIDPVPGLLAAAASLSVVLIGGALYEFLVVDPAWPRRPELIQPARGGVSRRRFWIPAHALFETVALAALIVCWSRTDIRDWLLVGIGAHFVMRVWSAFDFIPKAAAFERAAEVDEQAARRWSRRSLWRFPLDLVTGAAMIIALCVAIGGA